MFICKWFLICLNEWKAIQYVIKKNKFMYSYVKRISTLILIDPVSEKRGLN